MRLERHRSIYAPRTDVFDHVATPDNYVDFFPGIVQWEPESDREVGLGARYQIRMAVGTGYVGGLIEVVEFDRGRDMAWTSVTGIDMRGRWRLRARSAAVTETTLRLTYQVPGGGPISWIADRLAARQVASNLDGALAGLASAVESR